MNNPIIKARFMHQHKDKAVYEREIVIDTPTLNQYYGVTEDDLMSRTRKQPIAESRQMCMFMLYECGWTNADCGKRFNRNHHAAIHAIAEIGFLIQHDKQMKAKYNEIVKRL